MIVILWFSKHFKTKTNKIGDKQVFVLLRKKVLLSNIVLFLFLNELICYIKKKSEAIAQKYQF